LVQKLKLLGLNPNFQLKSINSLFRSWCRTIFTHENSNNPSLQVWIYYHLYSAPFIIHRLITPLWADLTLVLTMHGNYHPWVINIHRSPQFVGTKQWSPP